MEETLRMFTKALADAIRDRDGTTEEINPQDFVERILALPSVSALPQKGEIRIFYDSTKPKDIWGGSWDESVFPYGTFLMAAGSGGTAGQTGGSNTHTHSLGTPNDTSAFALIQYNNYSQGSGLGILSGDYNGGYRPTELAKLDMGYLSNQDLGARGGAVQVVGTTKGADNRPLYRTVHVWRKVS